jgi:acyl-CoA reductase-like NAD-dependent aldehyde dehydrogenase
MLQIRSPADGTLLCEVPEDDSSSIQAKVLRAQNAQAAWGATPLPARLGILARFRAMLVERRADLSLTLTREMGKPIAQSSNELKGVLGRIDFLLENVGEVIGERTVLDDTNRRIRESISHEPLGVVANISAWNYPYFVGANVFVPALLAGNCLVYKPSEFATLTGLAIAELMYEAGIPEDVFPVIVGSGEAGRNLVLQDIDGVFFTGSYKTGRKIAAALAGSFVRTQLELGGKDPAYVCDDANPLVAAKSLAEGAFYNCGQSCCSVERIYVHERVYEPFVEAFLDEVASFRIGDPLSEETYVGPLARPEQIPFLQSQVDDAKRKGAVILCGGGRAGSVGNYFQPTVLVNVDHSMEVMREESFGPVIGIQMVRDDAEALRLMNDTSYGLTAGVFTTDGERARAILSGVCVGSAYWNCCDRVSPRLPWSGCGRSGMGLTLSTYGIQAFTRPKAWHFCAA